MLPVLHRSLRYPLPWCMRQSRGKDALMVPHWSSASRREMPTSTYMVSLKCLRSVIPVCFTYSLEMMETERRTSGCKILAVGKVRDEPTTSVLGYCGRDWQACTTVWQARSKVELKHQFVHARVCVYVCVCSSCWSPAQWGLPEIFEAEEYFLRKKKARGKTRITRSPSMSETFSSPWGNFMLYACLSGHIPSSFLFLFLSSSACLFLFLQDGFVRDITPGKEMKRRKERKSFSSFCAVFREVELS